MSERSNETSRPRTDGVPPRRWGKSFRLGDFEVDPARNRLRQGDRVTHLEPKPMEVLAFLAERAGEVVSRRELQDAIWDEVFVADGSLTLAISKLRKALGESAKSPRWVETVAKRGYRLAATVEWLPENSVDLEGSPAGTPEDLWQPVVAARSGRGELRRALGASVLVLVLAAAAWVTGGAGRPGETGFAPPRPVHLLEARPLTTRRGLEAHPTLSPDGDRLAYVRTGTSGGPTELVLQMLSGGDSRVLGRKNAAWPAFSPDGRRLAYTVVDRDGCRLFELDLGEFGTPERFLSRCGVASTWGLVWTPDGGALIFAAQESATSLSRIVRLELGDLSLKDLTAPPVGSSGDGYPGLSPDGRQLAFVRSRSRTVDEIRILDLGGGGERLLKLTDGPIRNVTWNQQGDALIYSLFGRFGFELWRQSLSGGPAWRLVVPAGEGVEPKVVADRLVFRSPNYGGSIRKLDSTVGQHTAWQPSTEIDLSPQHGPGGGVLFASSRGGGFDLWLEEMPGEAVRRVTRLGARRLGAPSFSPDGRRAVFAATVDLYSGLYMLDLPSGSVRRLTTGEWDDLTPSFSLDGSQVLFASDRDGSWQAWRMAASGGRAQRLTSRGGYAPVESSAGEIVYSKCDGGLFRLRVGGPEDSSHEDWLAATGGQITIPRRVEGGVEFVRQGPTGDVVAKLDLATGDVETVAALPANVLGSRVSPAPDGSGYLFAAAGEMESNVLIVEDFEL